MCPKVNASETTTETQARLVTLTLLTGTAQRLVEPRRQLSERTLDGGTLITRASTTTIGKRTCAIEAPAK